MRHVAGDVPRLLTGETDPTTDARFVRVYRTMEVAGVDEPAQAVTDQVLTPPSSRYRQLLAK
jgi:hypothetical protein